MFKAIGSLLKRIPLIEQIAVGLVIGIAVAVFRALSHSWEFSEICLLRR